MKKMNPDIVSSIFLIIIGVVTVVYLIPKSVPSNPIPALSPAFFPKLLTYTMLLLLLLLLAQSYFKKNNITKKIKQDKTLKTNSGIKKIIMINLVLFIYLILLANFGYIVSTPIFLVLLLNAFGENKLFHSLFFSFSMTFALYVIFYIVMKIKLP